MFLVHNLVRGERLKELFLVASMALLFMTVLLLTTPRLTYPQRALQTRGDHRAYIRMTLEPPGEYRLPPYCWRVMVPYVAKILPFGIERNFLFIAFVSVWLTGVSMYYLAKLLDFSRSEAFVGMLLFFTLMYATKWLIADFWLPDGLAHLLIVWAIYFIIARKDISFVLLLALGVLVKENALFVTPLYYTLNARKLIDLRLLARTVLLVTPAIAVLVAVRIGIPSSHSYDYLERLRRIGGERLDTLGPSTIVESYLLRTFGVAVSLLPFFAIRRNLSLALRFSPFILLVYSQLLFATNTERLLVLAFPAMILMALHGVREICKVTNTQAITFAFLVWALMALNLHYRPRSPAPIELQALLLVIFLAYTVQFSHRLPATSPVSQHTST